MKILTLTISLLVLSLFTLTAEGVGKKTIRKSNINLGFGLGCGYLKDQNYSPLSYSSSGVVVNAGYRRNINGNLLFLTSDIQFGELNTAVSEYNTSDHYNINLELGFLKNIPINCSEIKFRLGGQYHAYFDIVFYDSESAITFYGLHSLDLTGSISWNISSKHALSSTISLPVFGLLIRPPWTGWDIYTIYNESYPLFFKGRWTSLNDFFAFNLNILYHFSIATRWDLTAKYLFRYYRTDELETAIIASNQFTIGTSFSF